MSVSPFVLTDFLDRAPADAIAIVLPEQNLSITYGNLREQVKAVAEQLAAAGVRRGDRVATSLTNGLPVIVSFLAAGVAGTAAPLNPAYKEDDFRFYLDDTAAKVFLLPPDGAEDAGGVVGADVPEQEPGPQLGGVLRALANRTNAEPVRLVFEGRSPAQVSR